MLEAVRVTDAQWDAMKAKFEEQMASGVQGAAMPDETYELIVSVIENWDEMTGTERCEMTANAHFWRKKYSGMRAEEGADRGLVDAATTKRVVGQSQLFEAIKEVHIHSACVAS